MYTNSESADAEWITILQGMHVRMESLALTAVIVMTRKVG